MSETGPAIEASNVRREFGAIRALNGVDLVQQRGESVTLFGPNGAGKTTFMRVLTLGLSAESDTLRIHGLDPRRNDREIRQAIGVISHQAFLYEELSPLENLIFFSRLYGIRDPQRRTEELLLEVGLGGRWDDPVRTLSRGMRQRVSVARSLVHDPQLVFLDEPFTGLDALASRMLSTTLRKLREQGRTVLLITHDLQLGLELSDRWLILSRGRVVDEGTSAQTDPARFETDYLARFTAKPRSRPRPPESISA